MASDTLKQEEQALSHRKDVNDGLYVLGAMVMGAAVVAAMFEAMPLIIGAVALAGAGLAGAAYVKSFAIEHDNVDLQARKSATLLTQSLEEKGVNLTPEQKQAITKEEYAKSKGEWQDRYEEAKHGYRMGEQVQFRIG